MNKENYDFMKNGALRYHKCTLTNSLFRVLTTLYFNKLLKKAIEDASFQTQVPF